MINIKKLHNKHKGPILIAGSDPSLYDYPDNYLDNKVSITLHLAYLKFPKATYRYFNELDRIIYCKEVNPKILEMKNIFGWPFYGRSEKECEEVVGENNAYYLNRESYPPRGDPSDIFMSAGQNAMSDMVKSALDASSDIFGGHGTCLHPCMYAAIMMGGNPIHLIGCNFKNIDGKEHFGKAHDIDHSMRPHTPSFTGYRGKRMELGLQAIIKGCKRFGIKVIRHERFTG